MTRQEAKAAGGKRYEGTPCTRCGGVERWVLGSHCIPCHRVHVNAHYRANAEKFKARYRTNAEMHKANRATRYRANADRIKAENAAYRAANPEKVAACSALYRAANLDRIKARGTEYRRANVDKRAKYDAEYRTTPKGRAAKAANSHKRRSLKQNHTDAAHAATAAELLALREAAIVPVAADGDGLCPLCFDVLTQGTATVDHIVPLSRKGSPAIWNCRVICSPCNSRKNAKLLDDHRAEQAQSLFSEEAT